MMSRLHHLYSGDLDNHMVLRMCSRVDRQTHTLPIEPADHAAFAWLVKESYGHLRLYVQLYVHY